MRHIHTKAIIVVLLTITILLPGFAHETTPEEYIVRIVYFVAKDRTPRQDAEERLNKIVKRAQKFYADYMEKFGFGRKTFRYEEDENGNVLIHQVIGKKNGEVYRKWPLACLTGEGTATRLQTRNTVLLVFLDHGSGFLANACGLAITGKRSLVPAYGTCSTWQVTAHELGHNFVLQHDYRPDGGIMGGPGDGLSQCAAEWLNLHPYFNGGKISEIENRVKINTLATVAYPQDNIHAFFELVDPDGLYHVRFLHETHHMHSCKSLSGERMVVQLDLATVKDKRVKLQTVDMNGNARYPNWISFSDVEPDMILDISPKGRVVKDGLIGYWSFDEATGKYAFDRNRNTHYARLSEGANLDFNAGKVGGALQLDGSRQNATVSNSAELMNGLDAFSLCLWVKSNGTDTDRGFINGRTPNDKDEFFGFRYDKDGWLGGQSNVIKAGITTTDGTHSLESSGNVQTTEWQHLAFTWRSDSPMKLYINGTLNTPSFIQPVISGTLSNVDKLIVGRGGKDRNRGWDGLIDDVRLYNKVLSVREIADLSFNNDKDVRIYGVDLAGTANLTTETIEDGADVEYVYTVTNTGYRNDTIKLTTSGNVNATLSETSVTLAPGTSSAVRLTVPRKTLATAGEHAVEVTATSQGDSTKTAHLTATTTVSPSYSLNIEDVNGYTTEIQHASREMNFPLTVTNTGNSDDTIVLTASGDVNVALSDTSVTLAPGVSKNIKINVQDTSLDIGDHAIKVTATSQSDNQEFEQRKIIIYVLSKDAQDIDLHDGLISYWSFDEVNENISSASNGNNDVTLQNGASLAFKEGQIGSAIRFDGSGDGATVNNGASLINGLNAFTLSLWIKSEHTNTDRGFVFPKNPNGEDEIFSIRYDADGISGEGKNVIKAGITTTGGNQLYESASSVQTTEWQHIALTWRSGRGITLYINGLLDQPTFNSPATSGHITGAEALFIGIGAKDENRSWVGYIDEVRLYNRVLRPTEVAKLAQGVE